MVVTKRFACSMTNTWTIFYTKLKIVQEKENYVARKITHFNIFTSILWTGNTGTTRETKKNGFSTINISQRHNNTIYNGTILSFFCRLNMFVKL